MAHEVTKNALILIDLQQGFLDSSYWGSRNNPELESNCTNILEFYRKKSLPVIHIQHLSKEIASPLRPGQSGVEFLQPFEPKKGERIFQKNVNSSFIGTGLDSYLKENHITSLTLIGLTSDHCVSTTARMGSNLGYKIHIVANCTATFDRRLQEKTFPADQVHQVHLASLHGEFATVFETLTDFKDFLFDRKNH